MPEQSPPKAKKASITPSIDGLDARLAAMWVHQEELVDAASYREHRAMAAAAQKAAPAADPAAVREPAPVQEPVAQEQHTSHEDLASHRAPAAGQEWASLGA